MSSASARMPNPLLALYSSTKGFVENFTKSLAVEYASVGISFQCQSPLYVSTAMTHPNSKVPVEKRATLATPTATAYARAAVARIGYDTMTSPYWLHEIYMWVQARLPDDLVGRAILSMHKGVRYHKKNKAKMEEKLAAQKKSN
jgi:17beta-estradiol 17-dehydrogenase / very-long-chain 3-oxoacyl-CoA reductase